MTIRALNTRLIETGIEYFDDEGTLYAFARAELQKGQVWYRFQVPMSVRKHSELGVFVTDSLLENLAACEYLALAVANSISR